MLFSFSEASFVNQSPQSLFVFEIYKTLLCYLLNPPVRKAIFDLDNTIVEGVTGVELARLLEEIGEDHDRWKDFWEKQKLFSNGSVTHDEAIICLSESFGRAVQGMEVQTFEQALRMLSKRIRIKDEFDEFYSWLIENQFQIFVITASPVEVFDAISNYRFEEVFGLILEKAHAFTGRVILPMTIQNKCRIVNEKIIKDATFTFGVSDLVYDMEAFKNLNLRFLLGDQFKINKTSILVKSFQEIKKILENTLN